MSDQERGDHEHYAEWDAAYVLGALTATERHEFEEHLAACTKCSAEVAELAALPGLLGALPAADATALLTETAETALPELG
ncbi:MAG: anti-sigma factor family protein, partial [Steroidobacteraceae bacterium]